MNWRQRIRGQAGWYVMAPLGVLIFSVACAAEAAHVFGRASVSMAQSKIAYEVPFAETSLRQNQQSVRLMASGKNLVENRQDFWSIQTIFGRSALGADGVVPTGFGRDQQQTVAEWLRHRSGAGRIFSRDSAEEWVEVSYLIDRIFYQFDWRSTSLKLGRQAVDFGIGRLWQPLNVFGAFAPNALDVDYKSGIDAAKLTWFSGVALELNLVHVVGANSASDATAFMGRGTLGAQGQWLWLVASLPRAMVYGAGFESEWRGWGWRVATSYGATTAQGDGQQGRRGFWVAGTDRQLGENATLTLEWYRHGAGASIVAGFTQLGQLENAGNARASLSWADTTRQIRARDQLGALVTYQVTPLLQLQGLALATRLRDIKHAQYRYSFAQQLSCLLSLSDESDLLISFFNGVGTGIQAEEVLGSDYGHIPYQLNARWRYYF